MKAPNPSINFNLSAARRINTQLFQRGVWIIAKYFGNYERNKKFGGIAKAEVP
jgi:hypothetical protein